MQKIVDYWEREGFLFSIPDELKEEMVKALEQKSINVRNGIDFKDSPEDYEQFVINYLDKEFLDEN